MKTARDLARFYFQRPYGAGLVLAALLLLLLPFAFEAKLFGLMLAIVLSVVATSADYFRLRAKERREAESKAPPLPETRRGRRRKQAED